MVEVFQEQILKLLNRPDYTPRRIPALAESLGVSEANYTEFREALKHLDRKGKINISGKIVSLPHMPSRVKGTFRGNPKGFGFVIPDDPNADGDLFIPPDGTGDLITGDKVIAKSIKKGMRDGQARYEGVILEIVQRTEANIVGTLKHPGSYWVVIPDGKQAVNQIMVDDVTAKNAKPDDKVTVEIIQYPSDGIPARGVILEVLGKAGLYESETLSVCSQFNLPGEFGRQCLDQARLASESFNIKTTTGRDDITDEIVVTIDPPDAKDFDDAISLKKNKDDNWVLGVHIADVSAFIPMDSPLDKEARDRGNSTYLPRKVIPMLPEILSNGICSLQPNQERFAKSAYITYDSEGKVLATEFANSIIKSKSRLTYLQADDIIHGRAADFPGEVVALIKDMETLARVIEKRRRKNGMLHLDLPETELIYDEDGKVIDAEPAEDSYPHTIIEMFMVEANEAVAALFDRFTVPFMRRIHPDPELRSLKQLQSIVKVCGFKIPRTLDRTVIQDLLEAVKGTPNSFAINTYILRSLQRAEYAPLHVGHFALASQHYCHFTSPIRRYADLLIHRLLQCYLEERLNMIGLEEVLPEQELNEIGKHITFTEQRSANAENELKTVLILQMLTDHIGEELNCVVSGLTNFGIFVRCLKFGVEGLIEFGDLGLDEWKFIEKSQAVVGVHSGKSVHLGEIMTVRIAAVNVAARQLTLAPAKPLVDSRTKFDSANNRKKARRSKYQRRQQRKR
ncbi:MAG: ribonuclease R [Sedimentisphaerales bacterium]|nr:ribonuclease R [Sedimentisphaerales bacterium]